MNLAQLYSLSSGQKLDKIYTFEKYYPLPFSNYIVIHPWSKPSKNYDYWEETLSIIFPLLEDKGIKIIQVGAKDEKPLNYCIHTQGNTSWGQLEYIISNCKLLLSTDTVSAHLAGHYNKSIVSLISNNFKECVQPFYGDKSRQIVLEPDRTNKNPTFSLDEGQNKQINEIKPELIAQSVCDLLNINYDYPYKTVYMGKSFHNKMLESDCTGIINTQQIGVPALIIRLDYNFNLAILEKQMAICKVSIITSNPIPINLLLHYKNQIIEVIYKIDKNNNPDFIKQLIENKIKFNMFSELSENQLNPIKLNYIDYGIIHQRKWMEIPDELKDKNLDNLYYKSSKITISNSGIYQSKWGLDNNLKIANLISEPQKLIDSNLDILYREQEYFIFLEKVS